MPDHSHTMSQAEAAVDYILERVVNDRNFSYYMLGTEALHRCLESKAAMTGVAYQAVEAELHEKMAQANGRLQRNGAHVAEVSVLRKRIDRIDQYLGHLRDRGRIEDPHYTQLCDFVHCDPGTWPEEDVF